MIDRNHPAVKAMIGRRLHVGDASDMAADRLTAALPYLASADLRDTPAGRWLMAEAWHEGVLSGAEPILESDGSVVVDLTLPNPYLGGNE